MIVEELLVVRLPPSPQGGNRVVERELHPVSELLPLLVPLARDHDGVTGASCTDSGGDRGLLESILAMADALRLTCVMEGVETREQLEELSGLNCEMAQGFHLGRPMAASAIADFVEGGTHGARRAPTNGNGARPTHSVPD